MLALTLNMYRLKNLNISNNVSYFNAPPLNLRSKVTTKICLYHDILKILLQNKI